jgi:predicted ester cyclase
MFEQNKAIARSIFEDGWNQGNPPTGKKAVIQGMVLLHIENGKVVARWEVLDSMSMMAQLGLLPV